MARVHVRSWQAAYRGLLPDAYLDSLKPEDRAGRYTFGSTDPLKPLTLVAVADDMIRGFATTTPARDPEAQGLGELAGLYVDPDWSGRGLGKALMRAAQARLAEQGFKLAILWVLAGNARAQRFYELSGWAADGRRRTDKVWGMVVDELRYSRKLP